MDDVAFTSEARNMEASLRRRTGRRAYPDTVIVDNALYRDGVRVDCGTEVSDLAGVRARATGAHDFVWIGLHEPSEHELEAVAALYGLHPLAVEDALSAHQRPKLERYEDSLFLVLKTLWYVDATDAVETGEINIFVGDDFVVTVRHGEGGSLHAARKELEGMQKLLAHGPSAVVYTVCDQVVDRYEEVAGQLVIDVDEVESSVFAPKRTNDAERIYVLKRELAEMRRAVLPLREPVHRFATGAVRGIDSDAAFSLLDWTAYIIFIVVIGGLGTIEGPVIGAILFIVLRSALADQGPIYLIVLGVIGIAVMLLAPKGIWGSFSQWTGIHLFPTRRRLEPTKPSSKAD